MPAAVLNLQRMAGNESVSALLSQQDEEPRSPVHDVVGSGGGSPLESGARSFLEGQMGTDFSDVRVHTGPKADESARSINAQAYTVGTDVVFRDGAYDPGSQSGRHVLAHELTHVMQQKAGPVSGTPAAGGISISSPSDSFEQAAERNAANVMGGSQTAQTAPAAAGAPVTAQLLGEGELQEDPEKDPTAQGLFAQRQEQGEELKEEDQGE